MTNKIKLLLGIMLSVALITGCSKSDPEEDWSDDQDVDSGVNTDTSLEVLNFDIALEEQDETDYKDVTEVIPSDTSDENYDDFVENSSFTTSVTITYSESEVTVNGLTEGISVSQNGGHIVVNSIIKGVDYILKGKTSDGSFKIYSENKFKLTLDGVQITNPTGAAINLQKKKRVFIESKADTENVLIDGTSYTTVENEDMKACLFSEAQLLFSGKGSLQVTGNYKHAICSDDYIRIRKECNISITSAAKDGIHANSAVIIDGGKLKITSTGDAVECEEGSIHINGGFIKMVTSGEKGAGLKASGNISVSDGIIQIQVSGSASKGLSSDANMMLTGGKITALTSGAPLYEDNDLSAASGIKCDSTLVINGATVILKSTGAAGKGISCDGIINIIGGTIKVITTGKQYVYGKLDSSAKGIKCDGAINITGATVLVKANGGEGSEGIESKSVLTIDNGSIAVSTYDDCLNASKSIVINGGSVYCYSSNNDGIDSNGTLTITGGEIVSSGTISPEEGFDCDQNTFKITGGTLLGIGGGSSIPTAGVSAQHVVLYGASGSADQYIHIQSADGTDLFTYKIPRNYSKMTLLFSSPKLVANTSYKIYTEGFLSGGTGFYGLFTNGDYTSGKQVATFTTSSMVTQVGNVGNGGF